MVPLLARSAALAFLIALTTSRLTLVAHELVGHGAVAAAMGADVERVGLFWFAGGYVDFERDEPYSRLEAHAVHLGGIVLELAMGALALLLARRLRDGSVARIALAGLGSIDIVHAGYYLAAGTFHGYGDGRVLHAELGAARPYAVAAVSIALVLVAALLARSFVGQLRRRLAPLGRRAALAVVAGSVIVAAGGHAVLAFGELELRRDRTYQQVMRDEATREVEREVAAYVEERERRGAAEMSAGELERIRRQLSEEHRPFPLQHVLLAAIALALLLGAGLAPDTTGVPLTWRELRGPGLACAGSVALVVSLSLVL